MKKEDSSLFYRPEIDGLRTIAVMIVLFYHAGFSWARGGYIGVDVFFVISGFLITKILVPKINGGDFSLLDFWARRLKRLSPALWVTLLFTCTTALTIYTRELLIPFGKSLISVGAFSSNVWFWHTQGQYFATDSELIPLLHTWSLGVEEQFYLLYPFLLLWLLRKHSIRHAAKWLAIIAFMSFVLALGFEQSQNSATFYLIPFRAWQLLVGGLLSLVPHEKLSIFKKDGFGFTPVLSLIGIFGSSLFFDRNVAGPQGWSLIPVLSTVLLIAYYSSHKAAHKQILYRALTLRPIVYLGLLSYPIYLWHQPLFAFARSLPIMLGVYEKLSLILGSIGLASATYHFIEKPLRHLSWKSNFQVIRVGLAGSLLIAGTGWCLSYLPVGRTLSATSVASLSRGDSLVDCLDFPPEAIAEFIPTCTVGQSHHPRMLIVGDSHSYATKEGLVEFAQRHNVSITLLSHSTCPPLPRVYFTATSFKNRRHDCELFNASLESVIEQTHPKVVVAIGKWESALSGNNEISLTPIPHEKVTLSTRQHALKKGLLHLKEMALSAGAQFFAMEQVPRIQFQPSQIIGLPLGGLLTDTTGSNSREQYLRFRRKSSPLLNEVAGPDHVLDPIDVFCDKKHCRSNTSGMSLYHDKHHISQNGARLLVSALFEKTLPPLSR